MRLKLNLYLEMIGPLPMEVEAEGETFDEAVQNLRLPFWIPVRKSGKLLLFPSSALRRMEVEEVAPPPLKPKPKPRRKYKRRVKKA